MRISPRQCEEGASQEWLKAGFLDIFRHPSITLICVLEGVFLFYLSNTSFNLRFGIFIIILAIWIPIFEVMSFMLLKDKRPGLPILPLPNNKLKLLQSSFHLNLSLLMQDKKTSVLSFVILTNSLALCFLLETNPNFYSPIPVFLLYFQVAYTMTLHASAIAVYVYTKDFRVNLDQVLEAISKNMSNNVSLLKISAYSVLWLFILGTFIPFHKDFNIFFYLIPSLLKALIVNTRFEAFCDIYDIGMKEKKKVPQPSLG